MTAAATAPSIPASVRAASTVRRNGWLLVVAAALYLAAPAFLSDFRLSLLAKYLCFAIAAIGVDLSWGYGGMMALGQGVFFGLGGYCMGMYLKLHDAGPGQLPDFMTWSGVEKLPVIWKPFSSPWFAIGAAIVVPVVVAFGLGLLVFRQRVRGAYFAILTQALAAAFVILLIGQQGITGGTNGLTNVTKLFSFDLASPNVQHGMFFVVVTFLGAAYLLARQVVRSRYGRLLIAVRDGENRVRFLGYNPALVKAIAFAFSAGLAGLAGALFVPVVGIISPALLGIVPSLELLIFVALGGRATLSGAVIGAVMVNWAKTTLSERFPSGWLYLQGGIFIVVIAFAPGGLSGLVGSVRARLRRRREAAPAGTAPVAAGASSLSELRTEVA